MNTTSCVRSNVDDAAEVTVYKELSLKDFLAIPQVIAEMEWTPSNTLVLEDIDVLDRLFDNEVVWSKIENWKYFACDLEVSFRINGTPFHYGQLVAASLPMRYGMDEDSFTTGVAFAPQVNDYSILQKHHVIIEPSKSNTTVLQIPYFAAKNFIDLEAYRYGNLDIGRRERAACGFDSITIQVLVPLKSTMSPTTNVHITVFARMINVRLNGISAVDNTTFMPATPSYFNRHLSTIEYLWDVFPNLPRAEREFEAQTMPPAAIEGAKKASNNSVSGSIVAKGEQVAGFVSDMASVATLAASFMGKPNVTSQTMTMMARCDAYNNTAGGNVAINLAALPDNYLARYKMCNDRNITSFKDICSKWGLLYKSYGIHSNYKNNFLTFPCAPLAIPVVRTHIGTDNHETITLVHTPLSFVACAFSYWRGTLRYKIHIVASDFHSGRLRITWNPNDTLTASTEHNRLGSMINKVIDIKGSAIHEIDIPFLSDWPYLSVYSPFEHSIPRVGNLSFSMVTPLTCGGTNIPSIFMNIYVSGVDMQFGAPDTRFVSCRTRMLAAPATIEQTAKQPDSPDSIFEFVGQAGEPRQGLVPYTPKMANGVCFGEELTRIEDLIQRPGLITTQAWQTTFASALILPSMNPGGENPPYNIGCSYMRYFRQAYRMWRGSVIIRRLESGDPRTMNYLHFNRSMKFGNLPIVSGIAVPCTSNNYIGYNKGAFMYDSSHNTGAVILPYYTNMLGIPNDTFYQYYASYVPGLVATSGGAQNNLELVESASDDYQYMYWLGAPLVSVSRDSFTKELPYFINSAIPL
jgi:hypothetical protein